MVVYKSNDAIQKYSLGSETFFDNPMWVRHKNKKEYYQR